MGRMPKRRFQFRLRTWFLVTAILAVQCAVCFPALKEWREQQELKIEVKRFMTVVIISGLRR